MGPHRGTLRRLLKSPIIIPNGGLNYRAIPIESSQKGFNIPDETNPQSQFRWSVVLISTQRLYWCPVGTATS